MTGKLKLLSVIAFIVFGIINPLPLRAAGAVFYVDGAAGNDINSGQQNSPWKTLTKAVSSISPGDVVIVNSGIYRISASGMNFGPAGQSGNLTTFKNAPGARVIITRTDDFPPFITTSDYVRIEGLWFGGVKNANSTPQCFCLGSSPIGNGKEIINNTFFGFIEGISGGSGQYYLIGGNRFVNTGQYATKQHGIYLSGDDQKGTGGASTHIVVDNNLFIGGEGYGIQGWHVVHNMIYSRNFVTNHNWGVVLDGSDHLITNNFFWKEKGDPGTKPWGESLAGIRTLTFNNIFGINAWIATDTEAIKTSNQNVIDHNAFSIFNMPDYWPIKPQGTNQIILTYGQEQSELGISESSLDATISNLQNSFSQPVNAIFQDQTIETNFSVIKNIKIPINSPLLNSGFKWFANPNPINIGNDSPAPNDQNGFWAAFRNLAPVYSLKEYDRFGNVTVAQPATPTPTAPVYNVADINRDGIVNIYDFGLMVQNFGRTQNQGFIPPNLDPDIVKNGAVDIYDFGLLVQNFGKT